MLPRSWNRPKVVCLYFLVLFLAFIADAAGAQVFDLEANRVQMAELRGLWRFHVGDDPRWSSRVFDDSGWSLLRSDKSWLTQGYEGYRGFAWYRAQVKLGGSHAPLALFIPAIRNAFQVFADGRLIGGAGAMPVHGEIPTEIVTKNQVFLIPDDLVDGAKPLVIAIRVWFSPGWQSSGSAPALGISTPIRIGDASTLESWRSTRVWWSLWTSESRAVEMGLETLGVLAGFVLFLLRRSDREYLWFGAFQLFNLLVDASYQFGTFFPFPIYYFTWFQESVNPFADLLMLLFVIDLLKQRRTWLTATAAFFLVLRFSAGAVALGTGWNDPGIERLSEFLFFVFVVAIVYRAFRGGNRDASLVFPIVLGYGLMMTAGFLGVFFPGTPAARATVSLSDWPFPFGALDVTNWLFDLATLAILLVRFARTREDEQRWLTELESARTVQQVLVPNEIPSIPWLAIECVYKPAGLVGGDLFQVIPTGNDGALIVIGDVSGKGMPAAMAVSLLVGTVRTLAHYTQSPSEILSAMNQRMLARSKDGFTTCLALHVARDGTIHIANAGHLQPYIDRRELALDSGLPLGLAADAIYAESSFDLAAGVQLTLLTDGVVEARSKTRELFGFERTAAISGESAERIADAAVAFGQEDDVTVLTIRRANSPENVTAPLAAVAFPANA